VLKGVSVPDDTGNSLDAVDLPIVLISRDCKIIGINRSASTVLGLTAADVGSLIGNALASVKDLDRICARVIADGAPHRIESWDGDRCFLVRIAPCSGNDRQISGAALAFTNVTAFRASIDQAIYEREYTKAILNTVIDPLVVLDSKLQIQTANRAFYDLFGLSRNDTHGVSVRTLGNSEWQTSKAWESIETALSRDVQSHAVEIDCEFPLIGNRTIMLNACRLTRDGNDLLLLTLHDITERKQAERATSLLAAIVGFSDDAIISKKLDGTITSWNKSAERLFGYTAEEAIGQHVTLIVPWERRSEQEEILRRLARGERVDHFETVRRRKDGTILDVSLAISPILDVEGKVTGASDVARDITEEKRIERALRESEERFRALVTASSDMIYRMSPSWSEMRALDGRGFIADTGKPREDWLNEYIHPDDQPLVLKTIREAVETKSVFRLEHRVRRTDGTLGWTYSRAVPLLDEKGEIVEWFGAASDVTARREAEESYRKLAQTLDAQVRARTLELEQRNADVLRQAGQVTELSRRLLHAQDEERRHIARELHDSAGQTLTVLGMSLAQLVQKAGRSSPDLATDAEDIRELMQQLHREIRTTSYLLHPPLLDEIGLSSALSWYIDGLRERSDVVITLFVSEEIGRLPGDMELAIFRVVQECLTNIHRHSGSKTASISLARHSDAIVVEVRDSGSGISAQKLAELQYGGSGVGIGGMHERVRQLGGELKIDSDGSGTRVSLTIPAVKTALQQEPGSIQSLQASV
jgi:PAS domain S-box-containing protein